MKKFRLHLLGLVHLPTARKYLSCAFTAKNVKLSKMLCDLGHEVFLYGARSKEEAPLEEYVASENFHFVETHKVEDIARTWGDGDNRFEIGYSYLNSDYRHDFNSPRTPLTGKFYAACIEHINKVKKRDDFLLCTQGSYQSPIADAVKLFLTCEPGVGYRGSVEGRFRAFESDYIRNFTAGSANPFECINGSYYDRTIPNYFDPDDIEFSAEKDDYYFFIGRMIKRKGIISAALACEHLGKKLIIAGQGAHVTSRGTLLPNDTPDFELQPATWEYVGYVNVEQRKRLMACAIATFTPTEYLECFAGTHVESMLSGTPVITTDFGVFPGTVPNHLDGMHHLTPIKQAVGFRCNTLQEFVDAAVLAKDVDPYFVRQYAERFLMNNVAQEYQRWFAQLYEVYESAVDSSKKGWHRLKEDLVSA